MSTGAAPRPVVALSVGDPAGIGPEIAMKLVREGSCPARLLLLCSKRVLDRERARTTDARELAIFSTPADFAGGDAEVGIDAESDRSGDDALRGGVAPYGAIDASAGAASHRWVLRGADLARRGEVAALVTGPIHKEAWGLAGVTSPGHTEALRDRAGVDHVLMCLTGGGLRVALATIHVPLVRVASLVTTAGLLRDLRLLDAEARRSFGVAAPRIAVCGLNPHAGEGGRFGSEDAEVVAPAVRAARAVGIDATGPLPADAAIPHAAAGRHDVVLALYHDQGLPAVKTLAPRTAVNVTLGLPFVRTSVDHGTAFDVAGRGVATTSSLRAAIVEAVAIAASRGRVGPFIRSVTGPT